MQRSFVKILSVCGIFAIYFSGCTHPAVVPGNYSGRFRWQNGLQELSPMQSPEEHGALDVKNKEISSEIESIIKKQLSLANVNAAEGVFKVSIIGSPPLLMTLQSFEIEKPNLSDLLRAVGQDDGDRVRQVIGLEHNLNQRDRPGQRSALFYAAAGRRTRAASALLELGADPNLPDFEGDTPLITAVAADSEEIARLLIRSGANLNQANQVGVTPLMRAADEGRLKLTVLLLQSGADPNYVSARGESALRIASAKGDKSVLGILRKFAATR